MIPALTTRQVAGKAKIVPQRQPRMAEEHLWIPPPKQCEDTSESDDFHMPGLEYNDDLALGNFSDAASVSESTKYALTSVSSLSTGVVTSASAAKSAKMVVHAENVVRESQSTRPVDETLFAKVSR